MATPRARVRPQEVKDLPIADLIGMIAEFSPDERAEIVATLTTHGFTFARRLKRKGWQQLLKPFFSEELSAFMKRNRVLDDVKTQQLGAVEATVKKSNKTKAKTKKPPPPPRKGRGDAAVVAAPEKRKVSKKPPPLPKRTVPAASVASEPSSVDGVRPLPTTPGTMMRAASTDSPAGVSKSRDLPPPGRPGSANQARRGHSRENSNKSKSLWEVKASNPPLRETLAPVLRMPVDRETKKAINNLTNFGVCSIKGCHERRTNLKGFCSQHGSGDSALSAAGGATATPTLPEVISHPLGFELLTMHLMSEHNVENIYYMKDVAAFKKMGGSGIDPSTGRSFAGRSAYEAALRDKAASIVDTYVRDSAELQINVSSKVQSDLVRAIDTNAVGVDMFDPACDTIFALLDRDAFRRFLASPLYARFVAERDEYDRRAAAQRFAARAELGNDLAQLKRELHSYSKIHKPYTSSTTVIPVKQEEKKRSKRFLADQMGISIP